LGGQAVPVEMSGFNFDTSSNTFTMSIRGEKGKVVTSASDYATPSYNSELYEKLNSLVEDESANGNKHVVILGDKLYARSSPNSSIWFGLTESFWDEGGLARLTAAALKYTKKTAYKTGGLADFTGPAWLDGTPSRPEYILNATQTERFFSLVDVLEGLDKNSKASASSGDNYFDIKINVEKIEDDYDVE
jgi:hypothetical protein